MGRHTSNKSLCDFPLQALNIFDWHIASLAAWIGCLQLRMCILCFIQATLALYASFAATESKSQRKQQQAQHNPSGYEHAPSHTASSRGSLTGTVIDAGDACTHIIPVVDGHVVGSSIKSFPVAGRDVTLFVESLLLERGEPVPPELSWEVAELVKEQHCYACGDMAKVRVNC